MARLIDADAFIERMKKDPLFPLVERYGLTGVIETQPTVDPVKHGRWMGTVCSVCGESFSEYYDCKFCPNCGAKMGEVSE